MYPGPGVELGGPEIMETPYSYAEFYLQKKKATLDKIHMPWFPRYWMKLILIISLICGRLFLTDDNESSSLPDAVGGQNNNVEDMHAKMVGFLIVNWN